MSWESELGPLWEQGRTKASLSLSTKSHFWVSEVADPGPTPCSRGPPPKGGQEDLFAHHPFGARAFIPKEKSLRFILVLKKPQSFQGAKVPQVHKLLWHWAPLSPAPLLAS